MRRGWWVIAGWVVLGATISRAGVLVVYDGGSTTSTNAPSCTNAHLTASCFTANDGRSLTYPSGNDPTPTYSMAAGGWNESNRWYEFTVTASPGYALDLESLVFDERAVNPAPTSWWVRCSIDGYASVLASGPTRSSFDDDGAMHVVTLDESDVTGSVTFRIGGTLAGNSGVKWRMDNVKLSGDVHAQAFRAVSIRKNSPLSITWESTVPSSYRVDYATNAVSSSWVTLYTNVVATGAVTTVTDNNLTDPVRVYRIVRMD